MMSYFCGRKNSTKQAWADFGDLTGKANRTNGYSGGFSNFGPWVGICRDYGDSLSYLVVNRYGSRKLIWLVVWNMNFMFPFSWKCHHPNWLIFFQRSRLKPPTNLLFFTWHWKEWHFRNLAKIQAHWIWDPGLAPLNNAWGIGRLRWGFPIL